MGLAQRKSVGDQHGQALAGPPALQSNHFDYFVQLLKARAGINLQDNKKSLVATRLARRLRVLGMRDWDQYADYLRAGNEGELQEFVNVLTTNKTSFFREPAHFDYVREKLLPDLARRGVRQPTFWVGATSYGQELYSLIMTIEEWQRAKGESLGWRILGTDIDTSVLNKTREGIYPAKEVEDSVPADLVRRYFLRGSGGNQGYYRFSDQYRSGIKLRYHNLCAESSPMPVKFDCIFLRNVLIYFDRPTVERVIHYALSSLTPEGVLILGHCETAFESKDKLKQVQHAVYKRLQK